MNKYHTLNVNDEAISFFSACGTYGESQSDIIIKVCKYYLQVTSRNNNGSFNGGKTIIKKIANKKQGG